MSVIFTFALYALWDRTVAAQQLAVLTPSAVPVVTPAATIAVIPKLAVTNAPRVVPKKVVAPKPVVMQTPPLAQTTTQIVTSVPVPVVVQPQPVVVPAPTPVAVKQPGQYKDGTYTGPVTDAYYGNVQVQAIVSGGRLVDVQFLSYPSDRNRSVSINTYAMPQLVSQAIQAQSGNVDGVSGATATSGAFVQSLTSALSAALNV